MNYRYRRISVAFGLTSFCAGAPARALPPAALPGNAAQSSPAASDCAHETRFHADFEIDPTAYVLDGYSLHVGLGWRALRFDLGVFGLRVPEFVHGQEDFEKVADGYGAKLQYFPFKEQSGAFIGVSAEYNRSSIHLQGSQLSARERQFVLGINAGFRFEIAANFYITPWLGVDYAFGADDVTLGARTFEENPLILFPAIHLGYRLR